MLPSQPTTRDMRIMDYLESTQTRSAATSTKTGAPNYSSLKHNSHEELVNRKYLGINIEAIIQRFFGNRPKTLHPKIQAAIDKTLNLATALLRLGNNVCFHGFGSKTDCVFQALQSQFEETHVVFRVKGLDSNLNLKNLLIRMIHRIQDAYQLKSLEVCFKDLMNVKSIGVNFLVQCFLKVVAESKQKYLIVFSHLDAPNFLSKKTLETLARISAVKEVTLAATIDSAVLPFFLSQEMLENFAFAFLELNTYLPYEAELLYLKSTEFSRRGNRNLESVNGILDSLTNSQRSAHQRPRTLRFRVFCGTRKKPVRRKSDFPGGQGKNAGHFPGPVFR